MESKHIKQICSERQNGCSVNSNREAALSEEEFSTILKKPLMHSFFASEMIAIEKGEVEQSHRSALAIIRTSETAVAAVGIWCVVIAVLVGYFVMRGISRPISDLTVATTKLAEGTWNQPIIFESKDEIGRLAKSFNTMAAQLESAQAELLKKTHLASVGQVASIIGHELRNPLGTIRTSIYSIDNKVPAKELGVERALDRIRRSINRCDNIIGGLLDYTRSLQLEPESIEFDPWLREMLEEYELPPEVRLEQNLCAGVEVLLDKESFRRVMINVLDNASHALHEEGEATSGKHCLTVETAVVSERLKIGVQDSGKGISHEDLERIFEPFFTTGTLSVGLGLPIVKKIVTQHHGGIEITSEERMGTRVLLWLPLHREEET